MATTTLASTLIEDTYQQIAAAVDVLIANGNGLAGIQRLVQDKRSETKTADFNQKIKEILGEKTTVEVDFVRYGYDETIFGDENHFLSWDIRGKHDKHHTKHADVTAEDVDNASASAASFRFSLENPLDNHRWTLPRKGKTETIEFGLPNNIYYRKGYETVRTWFVPCYESILRDTINKAGRLREEETILPAKPKSSEENDAQEARPALPPFSEARPALPPFSEARPSLPPFQEQMASLQKRQEEMDHLAKQQRARKARFRRETKGASLPKSSEEENDAQEARPALPPFEDRFSFREFIASVGKQREESAPLARQQYERLKAEHPAFSFRDAIPDLFEEMSEATGASLDDLETALEAIRTLAQEQIDFTDVFCKRNPTEDEASGG